MQVKLLENKLDLILNRLLIEHEEEKPMEVGVNQLLKPGLKIEAIATFARQTGLGLLETTVVKATETQITIADHGILSHPAF